MGFRFWGLGFPVSGLGDLEEALPLQDDLLHVGVGKQAVHNLMLKRCQREVHNLT